MNSSKSEGPTGSPPQTDQGTRVAYADAGAADARGLAALLAALDDPERRPAALLAPPVTRYGVTRSTPWSERGVTGPMATKVYAYASSTYLGGYSKVEAGTRWTRSSGKAPHLPLVRQTCHALGLDPTPRNRSAVGAAYAYLAALGVFAYRPGRGSHYAYLAYGPVALGSTAPAPAPHARGVSGGVPKFVGTGSTQVRGYARRGDLEENTLPAISRREPVAQSEERGLSTTKSKSNASGVALNRAGGLLLDAILQDIGGYGARYPRRLQETGYREHGGLIAQANRLGRLAQESEVEDAYAIAVRALNLGQETNLDAADDLPSLLASVLAKSDADAIRARLARYAPAPEPEEHAYTEDAYTEDAAEPAPLDRYAPESGEEPEHAPLYLQASAPQTVTDRATEHALYAIKGATTVAEVRPAYQVDRPLRDRLVEDAVRAASGWGGISDADAIALHGRYLDQRRAGTLDPERDLPDIEHALGRPLHLAEIALYGVTLRVSREEWAAAEDATRNYTGGAAEPRTVVEVHGAALAGTAVAP